MREASIMELARDFTPEDAPVLVTGATGYVGGRLTPRLLAQGVRVRCFARSPRKLAARPWSEDPGLEIVQGYASDEARMVEAMEGIEVAYYLIHSMLAAGGAYAHRDRILAETFARFARAAKRAGVKRIIYLGGLGETGDGLSEHLESRGRSSPPSARQGCR